jgi:hypothetical protein
MARRINPASDAETEGASELPDPIETPITPVEAAAPVVAKRLGPDPAEVAKLPAPKLYRVMRDSRVMYGGVPAVLKAGKTVSDATHDLHTLRAQGIPLEEIPYGR